MEQGILSGVLALSVVLLNPSSQAFVDTSPKIAAQEELRDYSVKQGETLSNIAQKEYGNLDFWTNIWIDNPWIENPNVIEKDWVLKLKVNQPLEAATLSAEFKEKIAEKQIVSAPRIVPTSTQAATPTVPVATATYAGGPLSEAQITFLGTCEAGMIPSRNTGNGYYGAFQFSYPTWKSMGTAYERADLAPLEVQKDAVQRLLMRSSIFTQFPGCSQKMRSLGII